MDIQHFSTPIANMASGYGDATVLQMLKRPTAVKGRAVTQLPQAAQSVGQTARTEAHLGRHVNVKV